MLDALSLKVGDTLLLGDTSLTVSAVIVIEPDRGGGFMNFSPRVMINTADLAATKLIQPASRLNYRMAVAGDDEKVRNFVTFADAQVKPATPGHAPPPAVHGPAQDHQRQDPPRGTAPQGRSAGDAACRGCRGVLRISVRLEALRSPRRLARQAAVEQRQFRGRPRPLSLQWPWGGAQCASSQPAMAESTTTKRGDCRP